MTTFKYTDTTHSVVHVIDDDGISRMSMLATLIPEGAVVAAEDPTPVAPAVCSPWQIRKALNHLNLRQSVEDAVSASHDMSLKDGWEYATEFRSDDPFVILMGDALAKTEEETRAIVVFASTL